jgi:hypothetical protein
MHCQKFVSMGHINLWIKKTAKYSLLPISILDVFNVNANVAGKRLGCTNLPVHVCYLISIFLLR